jgi:hypothetical protein
MGEPCLSERWPLTITCSPGLTPETISAFWSSWNPSSTTRRSAVLSAETYTTCSPRSVTTAMRGTRVLPSRRSVTMRTWAKSPGRTPAG